MRQKDRLYYIAKNGKSETQLIRYKDKRNEVIKLIREAKAQHLQKLQTSLSDPKPSPKTIV